MQPKQIQQRQMTQHQMTSKQMSNPQFTRQHNQHEHSMSIANPQRDNRSMSIPSGTFEEDGFGGLKIGTGGGSRLPFYWLRTWLFSLLALLALPLGAMLISLGFAMQDSGTVWTEYTATVSDYDAEKGIRFQYEDATGSRQRGNFEFDMEQLVTTSSNEVTLAVSSCDLLSRFWLPSEENATFSLWVNPEDNTQVSCIAVNPDMGAVWILLGFGLVLLSAIRLLRTINAAATRPAR